MHDALLATAEGDRIRCGLCPNDCLIAEGARGVCGARGVVGRHAAGAHLRSGQLDRRRSDREEAGLSLLPRQPASCRSAASAAPCAAATARTGRSPDPKGDDGSVPLRYVEPEAVVGLARDAGCAGVAFTYNEPVIWLEYVLDVARRRQGRRAVHRDGDQRLRHASGARPVRAVRRRVASRHQGIRGEHVPEAVPCRHPEVGSRARPSWRATSTACTSSA